MKKTPPSRFVGAEIRERIDTDALRGLSESWLYDCEAANHSPRTIGNRRERIRGLLWFLDHREYPECGVEELREFFVYLRRGHLELGGRFGNPRLNRPVTPGTVHSY